MRVNVHANMVFSGILNTDSKIGDLLINPKKLFDFIAPDFLRMEIKKRYPRLSKISALSIAEIQESEFQLYKDIIFISEEQIKPAISLASEELLSDVDPRDVHYIAYSKQFRCKI